MKASNSCKCFGQV